MHVDLWHVANRIASFEDAPSEVGRPTGSAEGGSSFEGLVANGITDVINFLLEIQGSSAHSVEVAINNLSSRKLRTNDGIIALSKDHRKMIFRLPGIKLEKTHDSPVEVKEQWLRRTYKVEEWYDQKISEFESKGWIPKEGKFADRSYPDIHKGLSIEFDGTILFIERDELRCKVLLECKSAKSSNKIQIDGNAHERFAYQNLEYLELAALYPRTQLLLLTNDAFVRYRNKYHTGFGVHGIRLANAFAWYDFDMVSTTSQYVRLFRRWHAWLEGK